MHGEPCHRMKFSLTLRSCYLSRDSVYSETALLRRRLAAAAA
jgi:hypothetical protein